jgi:hypothetical protein
VMAALARTLGIVLVLACTVTKPPACRVCGAVYVVVSGAVGEFRINPTVELPPTIPLTSHVTAAFCAPVTVACNAWAAPSGTAAAEGEIETPITARMETETEVAFDGSACGVAMICTVAGDGANDGAVYTPLEEIVPHEAPAQPAPATLQEITRLGFEPAAGVSVAAKVAVVPVVTDEGPDTARENKLVTVMAPVALLDGSATLMAVTEMLGGAVRTCGAVYIPEESTAPHAAPGHPIPEITQVTLRLGLPAEFTMAVNGRDVPKSTSIV